MHFFIVPSEVRNFTCSEVYETVIKLSWIEPESKNGILETYRVSGDNRTEVINGSLSSVMFDGLREFLFLLFCYLLLISLGGNLLTVCQFHRNSISVTMENRAITKTPYKEKKSLVVIL